MTFIGRYLLYTCQQPCREHCFLNTTPESTSLAASIRSDNRSKTSLSLRCCTSLAFLQQSYHAFRLCPFLTTNYLTAYRKHCFMNNAPGMTSSRHPFGLVIKVELLYIFVAMHL